MSPKLRITYVIAAVMIVAAAGCAPEELVIDTGSKPPGVGGTVAGTVSASGTVPVAMRTVTSVEVSSGQRHEASTGSSGGYTIKLPSGRHRLEVELRAGEMLTKQPDPTFQTLAAAGAIVLLAIVLSMNAVAIFVRNRYRKQW